MRPPSTRSGGRAILADAERPATPALSSPVVAPAAAAPAAAAATATAQAGGSAPRLRPLPGSSRQDAAAANGQGAGHFDELAFLSSVVDANAPGAAVPKAPPAAAKPQAPTAAANFAPVARPAPPPSRNPFATRAQEKIINNDGAAGPRIDARKPGAPGGLAGNVSGDQPIVLRDKSSEAAKSLKCGECGATNLPTEWYCERCGAELASM